MSPRSVGDTRAAPYRGAGGRTDMTSSGVAMFLWLPVRIITVAIIYLREIMNIGKIIIIY